MAKRVCSNPGCPNLVTSGRCPSCQAEAEARRGTASARGYGAKHRRQFRSQVLDREPTCVVCHTAPSDVADHYPLSRRELVDRGLDPDDPAHGRGVCTPCHGRETAQHQPGGWHDHH